MGVEQLQLLVGFSNVTGLVPFRMVLDEITGKFKRFDGHWRHPSNWWFTFILIAQILNLIAAYYFTLFVIFDSVEDIVSLFLVYKFLVLLYLLNFSILLWIPRFFLFQFRHLETAFECLLATDRILETFSHPPCTSRRRTQFGMAFCLIFVRIL